MKILIVGGSGGIGSALVNHYLTSGMTTQIYSTFFTTRSTINSPEIKWFKVDVTSENDILCLAKEIPQLDLLINATGYLHDISNRPEKTINVFNADFFSKNIDINTRSTVLLATPMKS